MGCMEKMVAWEKGLHGKKGCMGKRVAWKNGLHGKKGCMGKKMKHRIFLVLRNRLPSLFHLVFGKIIDC